MLKDFRLGTIAFLALLAIPLTFELTQHMYPTTPRAESQTLAAVTTPAPTDACKTGLNTFAVQESCPEGYRYAKYTCYDGTSGMLGGSTSCKSANVWMETARQICAGHSSCTVSVTPTPSLVSCKRGLNSYAFENDCTIPGYATRGYRKMSYSCYDGTKGTFTMKACQFGENLIKSATQICQTYDTSCSGPTPTAVRLTPTVTKTITPTMTMSPPPGVKLQENFEGRQ